MVLFCSCIQLCSTAISTGIVGERRSQK